MYKGSLGDSILLYCFLYEVSCPCFLAQPGLKKCPTIPPGQQISGHNCACLQSRTVRYRVSVDFSCVKKFCCGIETDISDTHVSTCFVKSLLLSFYLLFSHSCKKFCHQGSTAYTCNFYLYIKLLLPLLGVANFLV